MDFPTSFFRGYRSYLVEMRLYRVLQPLLTISRPPPVANYPFSDIFSRRTLRRPSPRSPKTLDRRPVRCVLLIHTWLLCWIGKFASAGTTLRTIANSIETCIIYNRFVLNHVELLLLQFRRWFISIRISKHPMSAPVALSSCAPGPSLLLWPSPLI